MAQNGGSAPSFPFPYGDSPSSRWGRHYINCEVCDIDLDHPERHRLCRIGAELRDAAIADMRPQAKGVRVA